MANAYINIYKDNPTAGATDGTAVSMGSSYVAPVIFTLDAAQNEAQTVKLAVRTQAGYVVNQATISDLNDTNDKLKLCKTEDGDFTDEITFDQISTTNIIFYAKATSTSSERATNDRSIKIRVKGILVVV